jgi:hypothetical protein
MSETPAAAVEAKNLRLLDSRLLDFRSIMVQSSFLLPHAFA